MGALEFAEGRLRGPDGADSPWPQFAVLGDPVGHSLSPRLHAAALAARGIDATYRAVRVAPADLADALAVAIEHGARGLNLTVPHKESGLDLVARATDECRHIGAANTLVARAGTWIAHNTDARGMAMSLDRAMGAQLSGHLRECVLIGAGGAARAAAAALEGLGARRITVAARRPDRAAWCARFHASAVALDEAEFRTATLVVNCTPAGLDPDDDPPVDPARLNRDAYVLDLTYADRPSRLLREFGGRGQDGRGMLIAQAALAFSVWFGALPPVAEMAAAIGLDW